MDVFEKFRYEMSEEIRLIKINQDFLLDLIKNFEVKR